MDDTVNGRYHVHVCGVRPSVALALLALWERPWSSAAFRFAFHALYRAMLRGCDVLEADALRLGESP